MGGAAAGLATGVLVLRRRPARTASAVLRKLRRPASLVALAASVAYFGLGFGWYAAVFPPRPLSTRWYDDWGWGTRPCCFQAWHCGLHPNDLDGLACDWHAAEDVWRLVDDATATTYDGCGQLAVFAAQKNASAVV